VGGGVLLGRRAARATLTLNDPYWDKVNVQIGSPSGPIATSREAGYIETKDLVIAQGAVRDDQVPPDATVCWRHDRNPTSPLPGVWSGWTRATLQRAGPPRPTLTLSRAAGEGIAFSRLPKAMLRL